MYLFYSILCFIFAKKLKCDKGHLGLNIVILARTSLTGVQVLENLQCLVQMFSVSNRLHLHSGAMFLPPPQSDVVGLQSVASVRPALAKQVLLKWKPKGDR